MIWRFDQCNCWHGHDWFQIERFGYHATLASHCVKYARIRVFYDTYLPVSGQGCRFSPYRGKYGSEKTRILASSTQCCGKTGQPSMVEVAMYYNGLSQTRLQVSVKFKRKEYSSVL